MPIFRCDFDVEGDLVLPNDENQLEMKMGEDISIAFQNEGRDSEGNATALVASVVGPGESIDRAQEKLRSELAEQLDLLAFVTQSRFKIIGPRRLIEWEAHQKTRQLRIFHTTDARFPPEPKLVQNFLKSVECLSMANPPPFARVALRNFRYGLLEGQPDDQFMRLWLALEIIAENVKNSERIQMVCSKCKAPMACSSCGAEQTRIPMARQSIEALIRKIVGAKAPEVVKRQFVARNGLMHGRSRESVERECKISMSAIVDELGSVTWHAIMSTIPYDGIELHLAHRSGIFSNMSMVLAARISFEHSENSPHPSEDKIPSGKVELLTRFDGPFNNGGASS